MGCGAGGADYGAGFSGEHFAIAGGLGIASGYAGSRLCGAGVGLARILGGRRVGRLRVDAATGAMGGETLIDLLLPGGRGGFAG
jgi:hypothetical protein